MKLNVDFSELNHTINKMGAEVVAFDIGTISTSSLDIDTILGTTGQEVNLEDLEYVDGLLSYHGRQILLYIPDHGHRVNDAIEDASKGKKYHISDCKTLKTMKEQNRFDRYIATNKLDGYFDISGVDYYTKEERTANIQLNVCRNCLSNINYKNYTERSQRKSVFEDFSLESFFEQYSTLFKHLPKLKNKIYSSIYTKDWDTVSLSYREMKKYMCEECDTSFLDNKKLLHTHHINGVKDDNSPSNLKAVCIDCHRKEPNHTHMMLGYSDLQIIYRLRREQHRIDFTSWTNVFKFADLSLHGYLHLLKKKHPNMKPPEVGYVYNERGNEITFDLAWTNTKRAIIVNSSDSQRKVSGWTIVTLGEALIKLQ